MNKKPILLRLSVVPLILLAPISYAQPMPENSAACQGGCDSGARDLNVQAENLHRATRNYNRGLAKLRKQEFVKAAKLFGKAAKVAPEKASFSYMAGSSFYFAGDHDKAKVYLVDALAIEGEDGIEPSQREIATDILKKIAE